MQKLALYALISTWAFLNVNCGKDDSPDNPDDGPTETFYQITEVTINDDGYTAPGTLSFWYSIDNGESYTTEKPADLSKGDELWVKINNGEVDIFEEDFYFDWSGSSLAPADTESDLAKFVVKESDITISASVTDKVELLVTNRDTGQFFVLDLSDGGLTPSFTMMKDEENALVDIRGVVHNPNNNQIYITNSEDGNGQLYAVDPSNMTPTLINDNGDDIWKGIADILITPNNQILATIGFGNGIDPALISFDTAGNAIEPMTFTGDDVPCCGLGMTFGDSQQEVLVGTGLSNPVKLYKSDLQGKVSEVIELTLDGFTITDNASDYYIRNLIRDNVGNVHALCYNLDSGNTHIAKVDIDGNRLIHIAQIGANGVYFGLVALPAYTF
ncbi:hypothetical protein [Flagellimonas algicola]|uniref:Uncharacterized protein n=1 Tax=Flagellimonas algicola TaxID=2583815 RepID=A0ABY2WLT5_9FLAO|nr:hypothetical protein [Allomuricauda algicola]TMU55968.1 hypothetical protein FGG15_00025 [Allomuricauda algicola]